MKEKLYKSNDDIVILGVCGGVVEYFGFNSTALRILCVIFCGATLWLYIALGILMPRKII